MARLPVPALSRSSLCSASTLRSNATLGARDRIDVRVASVLRVRVTAEAARRFLVARHVARAGALARGRTRRRARGLPPARLDPVRSARGRRSQPRPRAARARRRLRPGLVRPPLRAPRDLRGVQQGALLRPGERVPVVPRDVEPERGRALLAENADVAERVLERIRAEGPLSALDFERERGATTDWFGVPTNTVRAVLEAYAVTGVLGLARRDGNRRYYDLLERLLPADVLAREMPLTEQLRHKLLSRYRAHGLLGVGGGGDIFGGIGPAKPDPRLPGLSGPNRSARGARRATASSFPSRSRACAASASCSARRSSCWRRRRSRRPPSRSSPRSTPLVWDRGLLGILFGFDYVWELFLPPAKRRWGWYVLPMLFRDRLVGRIEPRIDRADGPRAGARPLVGGRLRAAPRRGVRRRDARRAPRLPALRRREPPRVGAAPPNGEAALPHSPVTRSSARRSRLSAGQSFSVS